MQSLIEILRVPSDIIIVVWQASQGIELKGSLKVFLFFEQYCKLCIHFLIAVIMVFMRTVLVHYIINGHPHTHIKLISTSVDSICNDPHRVLVLKMSRFCDESVLYSLQPYLSYMSYHCTAW